MVQQIIIHSDNISTITYDESVSSSTRVSYRPEKRNLFGKVVQKAGYYWRSPGLRYSDEYTFIGENKPITTVWLNIITKSTQTISLHFSKAETVGQIKPFMDKFSKMILNGKPFVVNAENDSHISITETQSK